MRRIIERVVTVVTTTWKISWEADPPFANTTSLESSGPETLQNSPPRPTTVEAKEVNESETKDRNISHGE
jgi:hypothetical protein